MLFLKLQYEGLPKMDWILQWHELAKMVQQQAIEDSRSEVVTWVITPTTALDPSRISIEGSVELCVPARLPIISTTSFDQSFISALHTVSEKPVYFRIEVDEQLNFRFIRPQATSLEEAAGIIATQLRSK